MTEFLGFFLSDGLGWNLGVSRFCLLDDTRRLAFPELTKLALCLKRQVSPVLR